jgi:hypothetical protein
MSREWITMYIIFPFSDTIHIVTCESVVLDECWIGDPICYTLWHSTWPYSTVYCSTHTHTHAHTQHTHTHSLSLCRCLVATSNGWLSPFCELPNSPWTQQPAQNGLTPAVHWLQLEVKVRVMLRPTVGRPVCLRESAGEPNPGPLDLLPGTDH